MECYLKFIKNNLQYICISQQEYASHNKYHLTIASIPVKSRIISTATTAK